MLFIFHVFFPQNIFNCRLGLLPDQRGSQHQLRHFPKLVFSNFSILYPSHHLVTFQTHPAKQWILSTEASISAEANLKLVFVKVSILYPSHQTSAFQSHLVKRDLNISISVPFSAKQILPTCSHLSDISHLIITSQTLWILLSNQFSISAEANMSLFLLIWFIPLPSQYKISSSPNNQI